MNELEGCIRFWEAKLKDQGLFDPSTQGVMKSTVKYLKELQEAKKNG